MMKIKILQEPFFHFLLLGGFLYLYYLTTPSAEQVSNKKTITISSQEIQSIRDTYKRGTNQVLSEKELELYIDKYYYEKVLKNEAYLLGLDKKDEVIQQRLLKKMQFIMTNSIKIDEPTEEQLQEYYKNNIKEYSDIDSLSFSNIFFKKKREDSDEFYELLLLEDVNASDSASYGDQCRLTNFVKDISLDEAKIIYGNYFAIKLFKFKSGVWHKSIASKFGMHYIYVTDKKVKNAHPFDEVEDRVYEDYKENQRRVQKEQSFKKIATQYSLEVE